MTSYYETPTGKLKAHVLPARMEEHVYVPIEGLVQWLKDQDGKYVWCGRCLCVRTKADYAAHKVIHTVDYVGGDYTA